MFGVMIRLIGISVLVVLTGCTREEPVAPFESSPELIRFFGGEYNLSVVQHAYSSSQLGILGPPPRSAPPAMHVEGRVARLSDIFGRSASYAWNQPIAGDFTPDIKIDFVGEEHYDPSLRASQKSPVVVLLDRNRHIAEVQVAGVVQGRANFSPAASRLEAFFASIGVKPASP